MGKKTISRKTSVVACMILKGPNGRNETPAQPEPSPMKWVGFGEEERRSERAFVYTVTDARLSEVRDDERSSYKERKGNALASGAEEGRDKLR